MASVFWKNVFNESVFFVEPLPLLFPFKGQIENVVIVNLFERNFSERVFFVDCFDLFTEVHHLLLEIEVLRFNSFNVFGEIRRRPLKGPFHQHFTKSIQTQNVSTGGPHYLWTFYFRIQDSRFKMTKTGNNEASA